MSGYFSTFTHVQWRRRFSGQICPQQHRPLWRVRGGAADRRQNVTGHGKSTESPKSSNSDICTHTYSIFWRISEFSAFLEDKMLFVFFFELMRKMFAHFYYIRCHGLQWDESRLLHVDFLFISNYPREILRGKCTNMKQQMRVIILCLHIIWFVYNSSKK